MIQRELAAYYMDFYAELLTPKQREVLALYVEEDYSLSEIAHDANVTRQGVHDVLRRALEKLVSFENKLGLYEQHLRVMERLDALQEELEKEELRRPIREALQALRKELED